MQTTESTLGIIYGNKAAELAEAASNYIKNTYGQDVSITDIGSSDNTGVQYNGDIYETNYSFNYIDENIDSITLQSDETPLLREGLIVKMDDYMQSIYKEIMLSTYLLEVCRKSTFLSDEAMAHSENWQDAI